MIDVGIIDKLKALKAKFSTPDADKLALKQIQDWEAEIMRLSQLDDFRNLAVTQGIIRVLKTRLKGILYDRAFKKDHTPESLKLLDVRETEVRYLLDLIAPTIDEEIETLSKLIDDELI